MTVWLLDVDGVVNSCPEPKAHMVKNYGPYVQTTVLDYPIWYSPRVIDFINYVSRSGVRIVWLTTWLDQARTDLAPALGLDEFEAVNVREGDDRCWETNWWKWRGAQTVLDAGVNSVIWTDDDLSRQVKAAFRHRYESAAVHALLMTPQSRPGLRPQDLARIEEFLNNC